VRFSIRIAPGVRLRPTSRGLGVSLGKGRTWLYLDPTGVGASTHVGPFRFYDWASAPRPKRPRLADLDAASARALADRLQQMLAVHRQEFPAARPPVAPPPPPVDERAIRRRCRRRELQGIPFFRLGERRAARRRAREAAAREIAEERARLERERAELQRELDEHWRLLLANDPATVLEALEAAFADNEAPAAAIDCADGRATVVALVEGEERVPERVPGRTPSGRPTLRRLTKTERNAFYRAWVFSNVLATVKEAFAVAPGLTAVTAVVLRRRRNPFGETSAEALYCGTFSRERFQRLDLASDRALDAPLHAEEVLVDVGGRTGELRPLDLASHPDLGRLVAAAAAEL
jgi:hypothetical protein